MNRKIVILFALALLHLTSCETLNQFAQQGFGDALNKPTTAEIAQGLKDALDSGTLNAIDLLGKKDGFLGDELIKIPFPKEISIVDETFRKIGLESVPDAFIQELNKGAEKAVVRARPIFQEAIREMNFQDAMEILLGDEQAATSYFETKTRQQLYEVFKPDVSSVLDQYGISKSYGALMQKYNSIPWVKPQNTDLIDYVTQKALDGLFIKIAREEAKIRADVNARTTASLKKVFGYADKQKRVQ